MFGEFSSMARVFGVTAAARPSTSGRKDGGIDTAVVSIKIPEPQFEGQTKSKLGNSIAQVAVSSFLNVKLAEYLLENPKVGEIITRRAIDAYTAREAARKAKETARRKSVFDSNSLPGKLAAEAVVFSKLNIRTKYKTLLNSSIFP